MKKITIITTGQPSGNPRMLKEAQALSKAGYRVTVLYSFWSSWGLGFDQEIIQTYPSIQFICIGGSSLQAKFTYQYTKARLAICRLLNYKLGFIPWLAEYMQARVYTELCSAAIAHRADLYIAHNLGALPIAVKAAQYHGTQCGFDAEDFHRQEATDDTSSLAYRVAKYLEDRYLPQVNYLTAASPLIAAEYKKLYPQLEPLVIHNVFPKPKNLPSFQKLEGLKLFWFSQTIGRNRGLETAIQAIGLIKNPAITLTLLGNVSPANQTYFSQVAKASGLEPHQLIFLAPVPPDEIFEIASQYNIGLALELSTPYNRDICLTNKIFTYLSAGIAIVATETQAQQEFIAPHPEVGKSFPIGDAQALAYIISQYSQDPSLLLQTQQAAYQLTIEKYNWEIESEKLLTLVNKLIVQTTQISL